MKEEKTKGKKKIVYYILLAACVLLLAAATVLTVYFVTNKGDIVENPGDNVVENPGDDTPGGDTGNKPDEGDKPVSGGDVVEPTFVVPVSGVQYKEEYDYIFTNSTLGWIYRHKALDFGAEAGTAVLCMTDGEVEEISYSETTGNYIVVNHGDNLKSYYRYVEPEASLKVGSKVKAGDRIATVAEAYGSEKCEGTHLHFEVWENDECVDPVKYVDAVLQEK